MAAQRRRLRLVKPNAPQCPPAMILGTIGGLRRDQQRLDGVFAP